MNPTAKKFSAVAIGGSLTVILVWAAKQFGGIDIPAEVAGAGGSLLSVLVSVAIPDAVEAE